MNEHVYSLNQIIQAKIIKLLAALFTNDSNCVTIRLLRNDVNLLHDKSHITFMIFGAQHVLFKTTNAGASKKHRGYLFVCPMYVPNSIN